ncbi:MAG: hypothetical protein H0X33_14505 [Taibaiella sp.]|nr:hypothetical protein [Taibaiella sp.]
MIQKEVWQDRIEGNLFKDNDFIKSGTDDSQYINYKTVHIPNAGTLPTVVKDLALGGARQNTAIRVDTPIDYGIHTYFALPWLVTNAEKVELSYPKMDSLLSEMQAILNQRVVEDILYAWGATGLAGTNNILRTSGYANNDTSAAQFAAYDLNNPAAGNRLLFTLWEMRQAKKFLDKQDCQAAGRHMLVSANQMDQLVNDLIATKYRSQIGDAFDIKTGMIQKLMGFTIWQRSSVLLYSNAATPVKKDPTAVTALDDNEAAIFWQEAGVSFAKGGVTVRYNPDQADAFGDMMSAEVRFGGAIRRTTESKVGAIVQRQPAV